MFGWLFKKKEREEDSRLEGKKLEMDDTFYFRPWSVFPVEQDLLEGMGAFKEEAVTDDDFYAPMQECLEEIFYREDE